MLKNIFTKALFILGILIVVVILAFAVVKILPRVFSGFASVGTAIKSPFQDKTIDLTVNNDDLKSGETTAVFWDYEIPEDGSYEIRYNCVDNLQVSATFIDGTKRLLCNTPYKISSDVNSVEITPTLTKANSLVDLPLYIKFADESGKVLADGNTKISVTNKKDAELASTATIIKTETVAPVTTTNPVTTNVYVPRYPDLAISNLVVVENGIVSFTVSNIGNGASGIWYFAYTTPDKETSLSPAQMSLNAGDAVRFTLRFNGMRTGDVRIQIDPANLIGETNESNNVITARVAGTVVDNNDDDDDYNSNDDADLEIVSFEVGRMNGSSFREDDTIDENDDAAVRFTVKNVGGESTGTWKFEIENTPDDGDDYESKTQPSLRPGQSSTVTVKFNNPDIGKFKMKLVVDSDDDIDEEEEDNNDETETLEVED